MRGNPDTDRSEGLATGPPYLGRMPHPARFSKPPNQHKDQQYNDYETKPTAAIISRPIERASAEPTEATKQCDD